LGLAGTEGTPESLNLSVIDEEEAFPSPPHDLDIYAPEPNGFELSQIVWTAMEILVTVWSPNMKENRKVVRGGDPREQMMQMWLGGTAMINRRGEKKLMLDL
jgi:hypothetical protein